MSDQNVNNNDNIKELFISLFPSVAKLKIKTGSKLLLSYLLGWKIKKKPIKFGNEYLANIFNKDESTIRRNIAELTKHNLIFPEHVSHKKSHRKQILVLIDNPTDEEKKKAIKIPYSLNQDPNLTNNQVITISYFKHRYEKHWSSGLRHIRFLTEILNFKDSRQTRNIIKQLNSTYPYVDYEGRKLSTNTVIDAQPSGNPCLSERYSMPNETVIHARILDPVLCPESNLELDPVQDYTDEIQSSFIDNQQRSDFKMNNKADNTDSNNQRMSSADYARRMNTIELDTIINDYRLPAKVKEEFRKDSVKKQLVCLRYKTYTLNNKQLYYDDPKLIPIIIINNQLNNYKHDIIYKKITAKESYVAYFAKVLSNSGTFTDSEDYNKRQRVETYTPWA